jgi:hypothetical protein
MTVIKLDQSRRVKRPKKRRSKNGAEVIVAPIITKLNIPADRILNAAIGKLDECVIIGTDKSGNDYFASNRSDAGTVIYHCERAKHRLMQMIDDLSK